ncbi:FAD-binding oxidoreductase [Oscillatoria sp. FACHB-1406]|uniref:FAD-binding oxidoreductase n=1 Tax=Oscillatoria sp. FACHB-1406 TaxID=2692846 RepID=UPI001686F836|nr:FAD-binding oxidoreductase [Oscillatoria sp. FACHB-1406]MBD2579770.1 FAD-binding oxidoreductase [Oscillatoria sp. FACHB-1406]
MRTSRKSNWEPEKIATILERPDFKLTDRAALASEWQQRLQSATLADPPLYFVSPATREDLSEILQQCDRHAWPVLPCGSGSKLNWGGLLTQPVALALSTQRLDRIIEYAIGDLTATVEAGVKLADLQTLLARHGQFLPLYPTAPESTTIGGLVATADTWRHRYGGARDSILGLSFARADGQIAKAGGRVVKNVAGYDLMKLFTGSYGSLGIITQVTFRTYPLPPDSATLVLSGDSDDIARVAQTLIASNLAPVQADVLSRAVTRASGWKEGLSIVARFQSIPESVREQCAQLEAIGKQCSLQAQNYRDAEEVALWERLQELIRNPASPDAVTCKIGVAPADAVEFCDRADSISEQRSLTALHLGVGLGRLQLEGENPLPALKQLRQLCQEKQGFLTILEAPARLKQQIEPWGYTGNALTLMNKIKQQFDPKNILSPGRY